MPENQNLLDLSGTPAQIHEPLTLFAEKIRESLAENLKSISIVGSSLTEDFRPGLSDINTVLVLGRLDRKALTAIASLAKPMSKKKISPPLLMTKPYIERSCDVFGVEFLDLQLTHKTILGDDPFVDLKISKNDARLQCERELKATLIRLRQGYIAAAANKKLVRDILISATKSLTPLLRAMLWLKDQKRPKTRSITFDAAAKQFDVDMTAAMTVASWRSRGVRPDPVEMENTFESLYKTAEQLAQTVDNLEV